MEFEQFKLFRLHVISNDDPYELSIFCNFKQLCHECVVTDVYL